MRALQHYLHHVRAIGLIPRVVARESRIGCLVALAIPLMTARASVLKESPAQSGVGLNGGRCPWARFDSRRGANINLGSGLARRCRDLTQVSDQRFGIVPRQILEAIFHHLRHRPGCGTASVGATGRQILKELLVGPAAEAKARVRRYVPGLPALQLRTRELSA